MQQIMQKGNEAIIQDLRTQISKFALSLNELKAQELSNLLFKMEEEKEIKSKEIKAINEVEINM